MSTFENEIGTLIEKHLPQVHGEMLRNRLEQAAKDAAELERLRGRVKMLEENSVTREDMIADLQKELRKHEHLATREEAVEKRERALRVEILEIKLQESERRAEAITNLVGQLVRNTEFRSQAFGSRPAGLDGYNNPILGGFNEDRTTSAG